MAVGLAPKIRGVRRLFIRAGLYIAVVLFLAFLLLPAQFALPFLLLEYVVLAISFYYGVTTPGNLLYRITHRKK